MKIGLVFPPPFDVTQPYLSLPMLTSFLRRRGHTVVQRDLNIAFYDHFLSKPYLLQAHETARDIAERAAALDEDPEWQDMLDRAVRLSISLIEQAAVNPASGSLSICSSVSTVDSKPAS
jgi:anaerobic magnesium-protoporphyrin IX monomethyl ester cyclase